MLCPLEFGFDVRQLDWSNLKRQSAGGSGEGMGDSSMSRPFDLMGVLTLLDGSRNSSNVRGLSQFDVENYGESILGSSSGSEADFRTLRT